MTKSCVDLIILFRRAPRGGEREAERVREREGEALHEVGCCHVCDSVVLRWFPGRSWGRTASAEPFRGWSSVTAERDSVRPGHLL